MEIIYAYYMRQPTPHEKQIRKDLSRTFPDQEYFKDVSGTGQESLYHIVKAYSLYDEECGYCQGMQFIVGPLLLNMPDEEAFSTLVRLMKSVSEQSSQSKLEVRVEIADVGASASLSSVWLARPFRAQYACAATEAVPIRPPA